MGQQDQEVQVLSIYELAEILGHELELAGKLDHLVQHHHSGKLWQRPSLGKDPLTSYNSFVYYDGGGDDVLKKTRNGGGGGSHGDYDSYVYFGGDDGVIPL